MEHITADRDRIVDRSSPDTEPDLSMRLATARSAIPNYEVLEVIGEGGMGVVYKARQRGLNRLVALKMIRGGERPRPDHLARIRIEAEAVARLRHVNIVHIYEIGEVDGLPFLSLELLEGGTLDDQLAGNPQPGRKAAELMATLARAIQTAHDAGIVHRDLKPSNILFTSDGIPKITDFGLAKRLESDSRQTESGQIMGTPCYMAPEQATGHTRDVGPPADVYALGAIFYEMLTGRPPFKGETPIETVRQVVSDEVVPPTRLVPKIARDLETICLHCLNKDQSRRYRSALGLAEDLERFLAGNPIKARPTPLWERGVKLARRRPLATTLWTFVLLAILGSTGAWLQEIQRKSGVQGSKALELVGVQDLLAGKQFRDAKPILTRIQGEISTETGLDDLTKRVKEMLAQCEQGLAIENARNTDHDRLDKFRELWRDAVFHETYFTGLNVTDDRGALRRSTVAALQVYAQRGTDDSWTMGPLPASSEPREQEEIKEGCFELLLTLAEAVDQPEKGLRLLDEAAKLRPPTRVYHLRRADLLARRGDEPAATRARELAKDLPTSSAIDHFLIGKEHYKRKEFSVALSHFGETLGLQPGHFWAHCLSAICALQLSRPFEARTDLSACLQTEKGFAWLYELRGFASYQIAVLARRSTETLQTTGGLLDDQAQLHRKAAEADFGKALELLKQKPNDELQYPLLVNRGLLWLECREWSKAIVDLEAAIRLNGAHWSAFEILAQVYERQDKPDQAIDQFTRAIALRPDLAALYRARALVDLRRTDQTSSGRERALRDLETAVRLEPSDARFLRFDHTNRARLLYREGRDVDALAACEAALKADPNFLEAHRLKIDVLRKLKRHSEAIRSCDVLVRRGELSAELFELRALAKQDLNDYQGAIEDDTLAIAMRPGNAGLLARRGGLFMVTDAPRSALRDFEEAVRLDPSSPSSADAYLGRGLARASLGQHREAAGDASRAVQQGELTDKRLYNAARIYARSAIAAAAEVKKTGQDAVGLVSRYQDQALELLKQAVKRLPAAQRPTFVRDVILTDPALSTLRHRTRSLELAESAHTADRPGQEPRN